MLITPGMYGFIFSTEKFEKKVCTADTGSQLGPMGKTNAFYCTSHTSLVKLATTPPPVFASTKSTKRSGNMYYCTIAAIFIFHMQSHKFYFTRQEESTHELFLEMISLFVLK